MGDWIEVTLHNLWDPDRPVPYFDYPTVPLEMKHKPSNRVSLNPQFLKYDPVNDSGINVGYNPKEQTVGPGESKRYLWKADREQRLSGSMYCSFRMESGFWMPREIWCGQQRDTAVIRQRLYTRHIQATG